MNFNCCFSTVTTKFNENQKNSTTTYPILSTHTNFDNICNHFKNTPLPLRYWLPIKSFSHLKTHCLSFHEFYIFFLFLLKMYVLRTCCVCRVNVNIIFLNNRGNTRGRQFEYQAIPVNHILQPLVNYNELW